MGLNDQCGVRGRASQGYGRFGQRGHGDAGRSRDGRGRGCGNELRAFASNVNITDLHRNFTSNK